MGGRWGDGFRDRLREIIRSDVEGATARAFASRVGVGEALAGQWLNGSRLPSAESLQQILTAFGSISADWLLRGIGPKYRGVTRSGEEIAEVLRSAILARVIASGADTAEYVEFLAPLVSGELLIDRVSRALIADLSSLRSWTMRFAQNELAVRKLTKLADPDLRPAIELLKSLEESLPVSAVTALVLNLNDGQSYKSEKIPWIGLSRSTNARRPNSSSKKRI
jgi:transcriptional regulator with XRE-family HTH domain